ncbi:SpoIIE family protein phosphatase [Ruficoccus amylovorans]|uniref:SpoIIE family protein phosphatase n=1 Tax=Ruficoccus amylovorans TaxID=1804625 RepID=A0A842HAJ3_9BACT|nr:SpoIIE family protein phosphatase [Ruficoccus amylovorans]MBC2593355.1 SpoIIE family protein phosphatase [Ruficoccus amylovorans]
MKTHEVKQVQDIYRMSIPALFDALLNESEDCIYFKDMKCRFVYVSQRHAKKFGVSSLEDIVGKTDFDFFTDEHARQAYEDEQEILRSGKPLINLTEKETWPDGSVTWVTSTKIPLHLNSGKLVGILGISRDITREKLALDKLEESERRLREKNRILQIDYDNARRVQSALIPGESQPCSFLDYSLVYNPLEAVGGDVLSFPSGRPDEFMFLLGDVCGHGISAALYTLLVKHVADQAVVDQPDHLELSLERVQKEISDLIRPNYVTMVAGRIRREQECYVLEVAHAGHPDILHYDSQRGTVEVIRLKRQDAIGFVTGRERCGERFELSVGDRLLFYTDGAVETVNECAEEFELDRLIKAFEAELSSPVKDMAAGINKRVREFRGKAPRMDDVTLLAVEITGA